MSKTKDYIGVRWQAKNHTFVVVSEAEPTIRASGRQMRRWNIKCLSCEKTFPVQIGVLKRQKNTQCPFCDAIHIGQKFGTLTVRSDRIIKKINQKNVPYRQCGCECGGEIEVREHNLKWGITQSCGCLLAKRAKEKIIDLTGQTFGYLTALKLDASIDKNGTYWKCKCKCKNILSVRYNNLVSGHTTSCGCRKKELLRNKPFTNLVGQTFGRLTAITMLPPQGQGRLYECVCSCGNKMVTRGNALTAGHTTSCGCYNKEQVSLRTSGRNNPRWNGGVSSLLDKIRHCPLMDSWKKKCLVGANYTCAYSLQRGGKLSVHHIVPFSKILEEHHITSLEDAENCDPLWDVENGAVLATKWHLHGGPNYKNSFHNVYGLKYFTEEDFYKWLHNSPFRKDIDGI